MKNDEKIKRLSKIFRMKVICSIADIPYDTYAAYSVRRGELSEERKKRLIYIMTHVEEFM